MTRNVILAVSCLLIGGAAGYFLAWGSLMDERMAARRAFEEARDEARRASGDSTSTPENQRPGTPDAASAPALGTSPLAEAIRTAGAETPPKGSGEIRGSAHTPDGRPMGGVKIRATPVDPEARRRWVRGQAAPEDPPLEDTVRRFLRDESRRRAGISNAITDVTGVFVLRGLAGAGYQIEGWLEGHEVGTGGWREGGWRPGEVVEVTVTPLAALKVAIRKPDGSSPVSATIHLTQTTAGGRVTRSELWSADDPLIVANAGEAEVCPNLGSSSDWTCKPQRVVLENGKPPAELTFHLVSVRGLRGKVRVPTGEKPKRITVVCAAAEPGTEPDLRRLSTHRTNTLTEPHNDYAFEFRDLEPGTYHVAAGRAHGIMEAAVPVQVGDAMADVEIALPAIDLAETFTARVSDPSGSPLPGVTFIGGIRRGSGSISSRSLTILREKDGVYQMAAYREGLAVRDRPPEVGATFFVTAQHGEFGSQTVPGGQPGAPEITIRFGAPARLVVTMTGFGTSPLKGKVVMTLVSKRSSELTGRTQEQGIELPDNGRSVHGPLAPGPWTVRVLAGPNPSSREVVHTQELDLAAGENSLTLPLPVLHKLTVAFEVKDAGDVISLRADRDSGGIFLVNATIGDDGRAHFETLPSGSYEVHANNRGRMKVVLPGPEVVAFVAQAVNAMRVRILDAAGSLSQAGFRTGDLIIGIDGVEFIEEAAMSSALGASVGRDRAVFTVLRNGGRIEVTAAPAQLRGRNSGGDIRPATR